MSAPGSDPVGLVFPGQGIPRVDVAAALHGAATHPLVQRLAEHLGTEQWDDLDLLDTAVAQPAVYVASVARSHGIDPGGVAMVMGHSLGELAALTFARALSPEDGFDAVVARGRLCRRLADERSGRMVAVMGLDALDVELARRIAVARFDGVLDVAGVNGRQQIVLSGDERVAAGLVPIVAGLGGMASVLPIGGAFHSSLMADGIDAFRAVLDGLQFREPTVPVVSPTDAARHDDVVGLPALLARALVLPVRWHESLEAMRAFGVARVIDCGPGRTLEKLGRRTGLVAFGTLDDLLPVE